MANRFQYEAKHIVFLKERVPLFNFKRVTEMFNHEFGTSITFKAIKTYCHKHKIYRPPEARHFQKGLTPWNKGIKGLMGNNVKGQFKKGQLPKNTQPVGAERLLEKDQVVEVKIAMPNVWKFRSHLVLEKAGINVPKNAIVFHLNGVGTDDRLENLMVISRTELLRINSCSRVYGMPYKQLPPELQEIVRLKAKLEQRTKERKRDLLQSTLSQQ